MKTALGLDSVSSFPYQLSPLENKTALPIPAIDFKEAAPSIAKIFNEETRIYAMPDEFFVTKFHDIFQQTRLRHRSSSELKTWLRRPNMKYSGTSLIRPPSGHGELVVLMGWSY